MKTTFVCVACKNEYDARREALTIECLKDEDDPLFSRTKCLTGGFGEPCLVCLNLRGWCEKCWYDETGERLDSFKETCGVI